MAKLQSTFFVPYRTHPPRQIKSCVCHGLGDVSNEMWNRGAVCRWCWAACESDGLGNQQLNGAEGLLYCFHLPLTH